MNLRASTKLGINPLEFWREGEDERLGQREMGRPKKGGKEMSANWNSEATRREMNHPAYRFQAGEVSQLIFRCHWNKNKLKYLPVKRANG